MRTAPHPLVAPPLGRRSARLRRRERSLRPPRSASEKAPAAARDRILPLPPPGAETDGLLHVSEISNDYVKDATEVLNVGDAVTVRVKLVNMEKKQARRLAPTLSSAPRWPPRVAPTPPALSGALSSPRPVVASLHLPDRGAQ